MIGVRARSTRRAVAGYSCLNNGYPLVQALNWRRPIERAAARADFGGQERQSQAQLRFAVVHDFGEEALKASAKNDLQRHNLPQIGLHVTALKIRDKGLMCA